MSDGSASTQRRLLSYSRPSRVFLFLAVSAGFVAVAVAVAQAWLLSDVIARVMIERQTLADVTPLLAMMLALAFARSAVVWIGDLLAQRSAGRLKDPLRANLSQQLLALGPTYTRGERSGELVNAAAQGVEDLDEYVTLFQPMRFLATIVPVFIAIVIFAIDPLTVLVLVVTGPVLVLFLALIGSRTKELSERRFLELSLMSAFFLDMLQGLATLKMFGRSREQVHNIRRISRSYGNTTLEVLGSVFQTAFVLELSTTIATALVAVEISLRLMDGGLPLRRALAVLIIVPEFFLPLRQLATKYHAGTAGKAAAQRIFAILDTPLPAPSVPPIPAVVPFRSEIHFQHVSVSYDSGQRQALDDLSLRIPHGQRVALVGATGAGKTTVANLLLRFVEPDRGTVTVDGVSLGALDPAAWRAQVAWVPQHPYLFYGTVADNIRLARTGASHTDVVAAAAAAYAHDFIVNLPQGYDTPIGENGVRLSGGEHQRLAVARAFLKDAPLLILDEATSHLDAESEAMIRDALDRLLRGRTALIIAHRMTMTHAADLVVVMQHGRVVEEGPPHSLLSRPGEYRRLVMAVEGAA